METYQLENDIKVICVTATAFPEGIEAAYNTLFDKAGSNGRVIYGLSKPDAQGVIVYKAAVTENFDGEASELGLESYSIPKGEYSTQTILDWQTNMQKFGTTFQALLDNPRLDWSSQCVEWYKSDNEVVCMVKLQPVK